MAKLGHTVAAAAIGSSAIAVVVALFIVANLYQEINVMYDETVQELGEFREIANDAWNNMMDKRKPEFQSIFRNKRQYDAAASGGAASAGAEAGAGGQCSKLLYYKNAKLKVQR